MQQLVEKTAAVIPQFRPADGKWQIYYLGFARGGWSEAAHHFAQEIANPAEKSADWTVVGMQLLDLTQVDNHLAEWAAARAKPPPGGPR